jgi:hypothetical protein
MKLLNLPLQQEPTESLVRNHRGLRKLLGNANLLVRTLWAEIRSRQKQEKSAA